MKNSIMTVLLISAFLLPQWAVAQSTPRIDKRQEKQDQRIEKGVQKGQLTEKEGARLEKGQEHVQKMEDHALKDGTVTKKEKKRIEHAQDQQSKKIARERHDKQKAKKSE